MSTTAIATVTVLEEVTIIEPAEGSAIYRYDIPEQGIIEGWALHSLCEQLEKSCPGVAVRIDAEEELRSTLASMLRSRGVAIASAQLPEEPEPVLAQELVKKDSASPFIKRFAMPAVTALVVVVLISGGVLWTTLTPKREPEQSAQATLPTSSQPSVPSPPPQQELPEEEHSVGSVVVAVPAGMVRRDEAEGRTLFSGHDPDLRLYVWLEPMDAAWKDIIIADAATASDLSNLNVGEDLVSYMEFPGDGSRAQWNVYANGSNVVNLICHFRTEPTKNQASICEDFVASRK